MRLESALNAQMKVQGACQTCVWIQGERSWAGGRNVAGVSPEMALKARDWGGGTLRTHRALSGTGRSGEEEELWRGGSGMC